LLQKRFCEAIQFVLFEQCPPMDSFLEHVMPSQYDHELLQRHTPVKSQ
jgi:hypothetical protein